ncbi:SspB family protein [Rhizomicrobium electricum]|uniref:ClpXP protease specificity-enhancing factor SspB n=1 Tax=Rhizomicrobium electricum TaxID=480070 RepID=A0ABN1EG75_9PROT|nr:ClpXP protease specificity-enhancing factor SspB [Rhizomicrobium electricum]NIJ48538.1 hypothetical protein [Rhizomicrobium electricum]
MTKDYIGYQALLDAALRGVVRDALRRIEKQGLIGSHHFYLTFKTGFPGVDIPSFLAEQYPDEMTIILQHQFWGLKIGDDSFEVALTFKKVPATLSIPFQALTKFFDPGVPFGLEFKTTEAEVKSAPAKPADAGSHTATEATPLAPKPKSEGEESGEPAAEKPAGAGEVVSLDQFRKK